jgi:hypothetical protein
MQRHKHLAISSAQQCAELINVGQRKTFCELVQAGLAMPRRIINLSQATTFQAVEISDDPGRIPGKHAIPNCVQIKLQWGQVDGIEATNVLHARYVPPFSPTPTIAEAVHQALAALFTSAGLEAFWPSGSSFFNVSLRDLNTLDQPEVPGTPGAMLGTSTQGPIPNEMAAVLTEQTGQTGPGSRGRIYLPNWAANAVASSGVIDPALMTALTAVANGLIGALLPSGLNLALALPARAAYTGITGATHPARIDQTMDVSAVVVRDNTWDSQRRRGLA